MHSVGENSSGAIGRFGMVVAAIVGTYIACVAWFGASHGAITPHFGQGAELLGRALISSACVALSLYLIRALKRSSGGSPFATIAQDFREKPSAGSIVTAIVVFMGWAGVLLAYSPMKRMIADVRGFPLDDTLAGIDHQFFGMDAWRITDIVFGSPLMTGLLQLCYTLWFYFMWGSIILCMVVGRRTLRWRYSIAFFLCWILIGSLAAYYLASAGPCFYGEAFHDGRFSELMDHLRRSDAVLHNISPYMGLQSLSFQAMLWDGFVNHRDRFGIGISAMPSIHVAISCLMALAAYQVSRRAGRIMTIFAAIIWIGSIQLGWHYASDGIVGGGMALMIWQAAGVITSWVILGNVRSMGLARSVPEATTPACSKD
jgi:hypothetical protein